MATTGTWDLLSQFLILLICYLEGYAPTFRLDWGKVSLYSNRAIQTFTMVLSHPPHHRPQDSCLPSPWRVWLQLNGASPLFCPQVSIFLLNSPRREPAPDHTAKEWSQGPPATQARLPFGPNAAHPLYFNHSFFPNGSRFYGPISSLPLN